MVEKNHQRMGFGESFVFGDQFEQCMDEMVPATYFRSVAVGSVFIVLREKTHQGGEEKIQEGKQEQQHGYLGARRRCNTHGNEERIRQVARQKKSHKKHPADQCDVFPNIAVPKMAQFMPQNRQQLFIGKLGDQGVKKDHPLGSAQSAEKRVEFGTFLSGIHDEHPLRPQAGLRISVSILSRSSPDSSGLNV